MKRNLPRLGKLIAAAIMMLCATNSFSQHNLYNLEHGSSSYYPHAHDSEVTVMPKLIKQNFIYYGFLSTLNQHISLEYDRQFTDELMFTGEIGVINSGLDQQTSNTTYGNTTTVSGGYFEGGVKLFFNPDYTRVGKHKYYTVEGLYLKPQIVVSVFSTIITTGSSYYVYPPPTTTQYNYTGAALMLSLGGQWMIAHTIAIDLYGGVGVSISNAYSSNQPEVYNYYSYLSAGSQVPLAVGGGINIGLPF